MSTAQTPTVTVGALTIRGPLQVETGRWSVTLEDDLTGEVLQRTGSLRQMQQLIEAATGQAPADPLAVEKQTSKSVDAAFVATSQSPAAAELTRLHTRVEAKGGEVKDPAKAPFNLRAVVDVLTDYELDPFAEIAKVLKAEVDTSAIDDAGNPVKKHAVGGVDRAKVLIELAQYVRPKLKAIEMKVDNPNKLTAAEVDARIAMFLAKGGMPTQ